METGKPRAGVARPAPGAGRELPRRGPILSRVHPRPPGGDASARASRELATVTPTFEMPLDRTARRFRRPLAVGLLLSVLLHVGLVLAAGPIGLGPARGATAGAHAPDRGPPAADRDVLRALSVRAVERRIRVPAPPRAVRAEPVELRTPSTEEESLAGSGLAPPARTGGGEAEGEAPGGGDVPVSPPVPRSVTPEWDVPAAVRGRSVTVRVRVDSTGVPTGPVELAPATPHEGFNRRLAESVRAMRFSPARTSAGRPVAAWAELTFSF